MGTRSCFFEEENAMPRYLVCLIFTAAVLVLTPTIVHAQTDQQQTTEPDQSTQSDEKSDQAAPPDTSDQTDQGEDPDADQLGDQSDQPSDDSEPQDR
jgi:hypothetical protein